MKRISICIPTYNRAACLAELLDSIATQISPEVEVVVSDDASPDDTPAAAEARRERIPGLTFIRQPRNIGLDRNFLAAVEAASADYIWFMGDDDRLEPGAVQAVLAALDRWPGVVGLTLGVIDYAPDLSAPTGVREMPPTTLLRGSGAVFSQIPDLLGFMSSLVIDRRAWLRVCAADPVLDFANYYIQVYILGRALGPDGAWGVLNAPCVAFRTSNDQFLSNLGWLKRLDVDVTAYEQIAAALFPRQPDVRRAMRRRIFETHVLARLRNAKLAEGPTPQLGGAIALLFRHYRTTPKFWTSGLPTLVVPKWLIRRARDAYQRLSKSSGAWRARRLTS